MKLPFIKERKWPKVAEPQEEKILNSSLEAEMESELLDELIRAYQKKDIRAFREAISVLIMNMMEEATDAT